MQHISIALQYARDQAEDAMKVELWQQGGPQPPQPTQPDPSCPFYNTVFVDGVIAGFGRDEAAERAQFFTNQERAKQHGKYKI